MGLARQRFAGLAPAVMVLVGLGAGAAFLASGTSAQAATITVSNTASSGYALAFGGLNYLDTGFPVTRDACRFQGNACAVSKALTVPVAQFDPTLGTLQQVQVRYVVNSSFSSRIQNRGSTVNGTWTTTFTGALMSTIGLAGVIPNDGNIPLFAFAFPSDPIPLSGFNSVLFPVNGSLGSASVAQTVTSFLTTNLMTSVNKAQEVSSVFSDAATLSAFSGLGSMVFDVAQHSQSRASNNSNTSFTLSRVSVAGPAGSSPFIDTFIHNFAPTVEVTYTYAPPAIVAAPEPASLALLGLGLAGLGVMRRRRVS